MRIWTQEEMKDLLETFFYEAFRLGIMAFCGLLGAGMLTVVVRSVWEGSTWLEASGVVTIVAVTAYLLVAVWNAKSPWWLFMTEYGPIRIGWRKRVIEIDWSATPMQVVVTTDDVTKEKDLVHAWSLEKALEYLTALRKIATQLPLEAKSKTKRELLPF